MHLYVHLAVSLVAGSIASLAFLSGINIAAVSFATLGAAVLDLDHILVIYTQKNAFTSTARQHISSRNVPGLVKHLASLDRKGIGVMYAHNFISMSAVVAALVLAANSGFWAWAFFLGPGILLHMVFDVLDDLITIKSFRNWMLHPKVIKEF